MTSFRCLVAAAAAGGLLAATPARAGFINTLPATSNLGPWGAVGVSPFPTFGQTFVPRSPDLSVLTGITFNAQNVTGPVDYFAAVYRWNGTNIVGDALFDSGTRTLTGVGNVFSTIAVPSVGLTPNVSHIVLFSTIGRGGSNGNVFFGTVANSAYADGAFKYSSATSFNNLRSPNGWGESDADMALRLDFANVSAVPAPPAVALALAGAASCGGLGWVRRRWANAG